MYSPSRLAPPRHVVTEIARYERPMAHRRRALPLVIAQPYPAINCFRFWIPTRYCTAMLLQTRHPVVQKPAARSYTLVWVEKITFSIMNLISAFSA